MSFIEQYNAMRSQLKIIDTYNAQLFHSDNVKMDYYISVFALSHTIFIGIRTMRVLLSKNENSKYFLHICIAVAITFSVSVSIVLVVYGSAKN